MIAIILMELNDEANLELDWSELEPKYDRAVDETLSLLSQKNHDYGEAWREMRVS